MPGIEELIAAANKVVETVDVNTARELVDNESVLFVDVRDIREVQREGKIPGAFHAPRGMLEFWIDPNSPYHKHQFATDRRLIFYCAMGWRSVLAAQTAQQMGLPSVAHLGGGFSAWTESGAQTESASRK